MKLTELWEEKELCMLNSLLWDEEDRLYTAIKHSRNRELKNECENLLSQYKAIRKKLIEVWTEERVNET